jgi:hypothetical protein
MNAHIQDEVTKQIPYVKESELALAVARAEKQDAKTIIEEMRKHRAQFEASKISSIGCAEFANDATWRSIAAESDRAARDILLENSDLLTELSEAERKADEASRAEEPRTTIIVQRVPELARESRAH